MAMGVTPKAGRKKVRCPKCTALFSEPTKAVFECPICACRLSANGATALCESSSHQTGEGVLGNDEPIKMQGPMDFVRKEGNSTNGNGVIQEEKSTDCEQNSVVSHSQIYKQQPIMESLGVFKNDDTDGQPSTGNSSLEGIVGKDGMLGPYSPMHSVSKPGDPVNGKHGGGSPPELCAGANEEAALVKTTGQHYFTDDASKENSLMVGEDSNLITAGDEGIERQDCVVNGVSSKQHLQSHIFRTTRCEFSFKYSLEGASPLQSDGDLIHRKRPPNAKIVSSTSPNTEASSMPLHTPLRVRISKSLEESSDQSENGRESFSSETDSDDTSGSDFDFPAPWADSLQDIVLPAPFSQNEVFHPNSESIVSAAPHQLELQDTYDIIDNEEFTSQQESGKHFKVSDAELSSQVENADKTIERESEARNEESSHGLLQPVLPSEKNHVLLGSPGRAEDTISDVKSLPSQTQSLDVSDLATHVSSFKHLGVAGTNEVLLMEGSEQKVSGFGLEEFSEGGEDQEAGLKEKFQPEKLGNIEPSTIAHQEACKPFDVVVPFDGGLVLDMNDHCNVKQESTLPNQEYLPSNLDHMYHSDETHNRSNTGGFQMVEFRETYDKGPCHSHQMIQGLSSRKSKTTQSINVANAWDGRTANGNGSSLTGKTEVEQDLYRLPHEIYGNDSLLGESSHSALWAEEDTAVSDGTFVSTSKAKVYQSLYGNLGSRVIRNDNGEDRFRSGEARNLRGPAASREASLQATSEHVDWEGHVTAAEDRSGHLDSHVMEGKPGSYSQYAVNNSLGFPLANPQPYAFANHHYGFGASGTSQIYPYPLPAQSLMHRAAFQNHALRHYGYHAVSPACMLCSYHQHPHMQPEHAHQCGTCFTQPGSIAYKSGLVEHWNCHQASSGPPSSCAGSLADYPQTRFSTEAIQRYDFPNAESRSRASSAIKYPPFPKNGAAPYFTCKGCFRVLQVPSNLPPIDGAMQKLRCGACGKVTKFSTDCYDQQRVLMYSTLPPDPDSVGGAANMLLQYGTHSRQLHVSSAIESMKSSYKHDMIKMNPVWHRLNEVSQQDNNAAASKSLEQKPQGAEFFRGQPRGRVTDASHNSYGEHDPLISVSTTGPPHVQNSSSVVGVMSPRNAALRPTDGFGFERSKVTVDEKEEGLDFGAPRISDGDSLDHSESRMRSPEYNQACLETTRVDVSQGALSGVHQPLEQVSDLSGDFDTAAHEKKPGSPLLVLLNQESTRFRLNLEPREPFEGSKTAMWSPASDSSVYANSLHDRLQNKEQDNRRSHGSPGQHFVSKGPKYIAGLLRRSLRDFGKGGQ